MENTSAAAATASFASKAELYAWLVVHARTTVAGINKSFTPQAKLMVALSTIASTCFYTLNNFAARASSATPLQLDNPLITWGGFYLLQAPGVMGVGPFQGKCNGVSEITVGRGVSGKAADCGRSLVVSDVSRFLDDTAHAPGTVSQVAAPILIQNGSVVGVLSLESAQAGRFDSEDAAGLEKLTEALAEVLEFPMTRALSINPSLAFPSSGPIPPLDSAARLGDNVRVMMPAPSTSATVADGSGPDSLLGSAPPTKVSIPYFTVDVVEPEKREKHVAGWRFVTSRLHRIMKQQELDDLERDIGISAFPEIQFPLNTFSIFTNTDSADASPFIAFRLLPILESSRTFYSTQRFKEIVGPQLVIPVSESWSSTPYTRFDPNVDWAWRNEYFGVREGLSVKPLELDMDGINWELLKNRDLPILFYDVLDIFEDDLHDHGVIQCSVKFRVMELAFFVLFRHFVRVDGHEVWMREVRYYHEFGSTRPVEGSGSVPHIVIAEQIRKYEINNPEDLSWRDMTADELSAKSTILDSHEYYIDFCTVRKD